MHGQYDIPLSDEGRKQAKRISDELKNENFDICFSSPLERARKTAIKILEHHRAVPIYYDSRLKELSKGLLEGRHFNSEKLLRDENPRFLEKYSIESKQQFYQRVENFIQEIENKYDNKKILIVAHSGTIKMCKFVFEKPKQPLHIAYYKIHISNCKAYKFEKKGINMKIGFFPMVADILHAGHIVALEEAKKKCDYLIVGLHCAPNYKNPQQSIYQRYMQLRAVKWVDEIIPYENIEKDIDMFKSLDYDIYFLGADHMQNNWELKDTIENLNKQIIYINRNHNYSSTRIKKESNLYATK